MNLTFTGLLYGAAAACLAVSFRKDREKTNQVSGSAAPFSHHPFDHGHSIYSRDTGDDPGRDRNRVRFQGNGPVSLDRSSCPGTGAGSVSYGLPAP